MMGILKKVFVKGKLDNHASIRLQEKVRYGIDF